MRLNIKPAVKRRMMGKPPGSQRDDLWPTIKDAFDLGMELRRPFERDWQLALSFLSGRQYTFYNKSTELIQHLIQRKGKLRVVDNKLLPRYRKQVSRLIRNSPRMSVVPNSSDQEDLKAAKIGDKVLKHLWRTMQMKKKLRILGGWIYSCGNGFLDDRWNPRLGPMVPDEKGELTYAGDVDVGVWSPFEIGVPAAGLNDVDLHEMPWMWKTKFRSIDYFRKQYGEAGKRVTAEERPTPYADTGILFGLGRGVSAASSQKVEGAAEIQLYIQPCAEFPKGKYLVGANGVVLRKKDYPLTHYHLEQFKDVEIPGLFWGIATTQMAIWLQKLHNRTLSDVAEYNRVIAKGKYRVPRGSKLSVAPDDTHGQILEYTPVMGHGPEVMDMKNLPASYQQVLEWVSISLMELYHQHEVTSGTNRSDIRSGDMVSLLLEQDDMGNLPTHAVFEESLEANMGRTLRRVQRGYEEERIVSVVGRGNQYEVFPFKGADLRNNTDVHVEKESSIPDSRMARQARIWKNYEMGLYGSPQDERTRQRVLRMLEETPEDMQDIFEESFVDRQNARVENATMIRQPGITYLVNEYDNHALHIEEHTFQRKQPEYQRLKLENPEQFGALETTFISHHRQHSKFLAEEQKAQMRMMAEMEGMKKGDGGGS